MDKTIGFLGECMVELKGDPKTGIAQGYSGDTLNTALYFSRMAPPGVGVEYVTAVGTDVFSDGMLELWRSEKIGCQFVQRRQDKLPGIYFIHVDDAGERHFSYWRDQSAARFYFDERLEANALQALAALDGLYLSGISLAILPPTGRDRLVQLLRDIKARGGAVYFDNNFRAKLWPQSAEARHAYEQVLALADIAFLTLDDEQQLFDCATVDAVLTRLEPLAIPEIVIKRGAQDCVIRTRDGGREAVPALPVAKIVDTTAAGDSFGAAYLAKRLAGAEPAQAAQAGHALAATVIQHEGAIIRRQYMPPA